MDWQPIETAPKDGREILLATKIDGEWCYALADAHEDEFDGDGWGVTRNIAPFTHWAQLEPPK